MYAVSSFGLRQQKKAAVCAWFIHHEGFVSFQVSMCKQCFHMLNNHTLFILHHLLLQKLKTMFIFTLTVQKPGRLIAFPCFHFQWDRLTFLWGHYSFQNASVTTLSFLLDSLQESLAGKASWLNPEAELRVLGSTSVHRLI